MDVVLWIVWLVTYLVGCVLYGLYQTHMFQQASYKPTEYAQWLRRGSNVGRQLGKTLYCLISIPLLLFAGRVGLMIAIVLNVLTILVNIPASAKKPLVYTGRVKRLLITLTLLLVIFAALSFILACLPGGRQLGAKVCGAVLAAYLCLMPFLVLLGNAVNHPMEQGINRHYINDAARILRDMPNLTIIGITGSYGKTSVKYFLNKLLSVQFSVLQTPGNYNTTLGVVRTIREQMKPFYEIFLCEMGAREVGDIKEICDLVHPDYGVITSIGPQHLQSFHTIENIIGTKFELADAVKEKGCVFLNYDNAYIRNHPIDKNKVSYGTAAEDVTYRAYDISVSREGSSFRMKDAAGKSYEFRTGLVGTHNVQNIAGAIAVANTLGIPMEKLVYPVRQLESVPHRLQLIRQGNRTILDDSYNSNKSGFKDALDTLSLFPDLRILMTPGMVELGDAEYAENFEVGAYAADKCDYAVLVGKDQTKPLQDGLKKEHFPENRMIVVDSLEDAFRMVNAIPEEKMKVILIENDLPDSYT